MRIKESLEFKVFTVSRRKFNFLEFFFYLKQSRALLKLIYSLIFFSVLLFVIMIGEDFKNAFNFILMFVLIISSYVIYKVEVWNSCYLINTERNEIKKVVKLFFFEIVVFSESFSGLVTIVKDEYNSYYYILFQNSKNKIILYFNSDDPRIEEIEIFRNIIDKKELKTIN